MKNAAGVICALLFVLFPVFSEGQSDTALGWIKDLAGNWQGTYEWSGARTGSGEMTVAYRLTADGSAVVEDLIVESKPVMTSVYHMDGSDLRMTHYCAANNQPRLKAVSIDRSGRQIKFDLVDITNLRSPESGHVHKFEIRPQDENRLTLLFTFLGKGQESVERIELTRVSK